MSIKIQYEGGEADYFAKKVVKKFGGSGMIIVPKGYIGKQALVAIKNTDVVELDEEDKK